MQVLAPALQAVRVDGRRPLRKETRAIRARAELGRPGFGLALGERSRTGSERRRKHEEEERLQGEGGGEEKRLAGGNDGNAPVS